MAIDYVAQPGLRRITITLRGRVHLMDVLGAIERQAADGAWQYGTLYDARGAETLLQNKDFVHVTDLVERLGRTRGRRGPVAFALVDPREVDAIRVFARQLTASGAQSEVDVFASLDEAHRWLDARVGTGQVAAAAQRNDQEPGFGAYTVAGRIVTVRATRAPTAEETRRVFRALGADPHVPSDLLLLIDARAIDGFWSKAAIERWAQTVREVLSPKRLPSLAIVHCRTLAGPVNPARRDKGRTILGLRVGTFTSFDKAREWLEAH